MAICTSGQTKRFAIFDRLHKRVRNAYRVVRILILHTGNIFAAKIHVIAGIAQDTDFVLFTNFSLDELFDIWVIDVKYHHLGGSAGCAARFNCAGGCISAAHERDRP